jgi:hypothetical protein
MTRLYWSADHQNYWIGYTAETGYVIFPAEADGWTKKKPFQGFDPLRIREVPARLAFNTGFPVRDTEKRASTAA